MESVVTFLQDVVPQVSVWGFRNSRFYLCPGSLLNVLFPKLDTSITNFKKTWCFSILNIGREELYLLLDVPEFCADCGTIIIPQNVLS